jgi:hypothetical protein
MTLIEKIEVMQHFERGGEVEFKYRSVKDDLYYDAKGEISWNWEKYIYRIKPKPAELLYEYWFETYGGSIRIYNKLITEEEANESFENVYPKYKYGKTGRYFNPETKIFGD